MKMKKLVCLALCATMICGSLTVTAFAQPIDDFHAAQVQKGIEEQAAREAAYEAGKAQVEAFQKAQAEAASWLAAYNATQTEAAKAQAAAGLATAQAGQAATQAFQTAQLDAASWLAAYNAAQTDAGKAQAAAGLAAAQAGQTATAEFQAAQKEAANWLAAYKCSTDRSSKSTGSSRTCKSTGRTGNYSTVSGSTGLKRSIFFSRLVCTGKSRRSS